MVDCHPERSEGSQYFLQEHTGMLGFVQHDIEALNGWVGSHTPESEAKKFQTVKEQVTLWLKLIMKTTVT